MKGMMVRRAALDEAVKEKIRNRVKKLLEEKNVKSNGESDGDSAPQEDVEDSGEGSIMLFDEPVSSIVARIASRLVSMEFPTKDALNTYLEEHPDADRSQHSVVPETKGKGKEEKPKEKQGPGEEDKSKGRKPGKEEKPTGDKTPKKEEKPEGKGKPEEKPGEEKPQEKQEKGEGEKKEEPKKEEKKAPAVDHNHPSKVPPGPARQIALKDALIDQVGTDAKNWGTHAIHESQLTDGVVVRFPEGTSKKYGDLNDTEKTRVQKAIKDGTAASKGVNDYTGVNVSTMRKNMANNLSIYDDDSVEETKNTSTEPASKKNVSEFSSSLRENGMNLVRKYGMALSPVSKPLAEHYVNEFASTIHEAISDGSMAGVSQSDIDDFFRDDVKRLIHQEVETRRRSLGDHGIRHIIGNVKSTMSMMNDMASHGVPITGKQKLMGLAIQANHDMGYTLGAAATDTKKGGDHKSQSKTIADEEEKSTQRYSKIFGDKDSEFIRHVIETHDSTEVDWEEDPVGSSVRVSDNMSLFGEDKVQDLFIRSPKTMGLACKLRLAVEAKPDDKELQDSIKEQFHKEIDSGDYADSDKEVLKRQVDEMTEGRYKDASDILSRFSGRIKGFKFNPDKKVMNVGMKYSPEGQTVDMLFGDELAGMQFGKMIDDLHGQPVRGKVGQTDLKNPKGKTVIHIDIEGFEDEPVESAATSSMRDFMKKTARSELRQAAGLLIPPPVKDATEKAQKAMEGAKGKFTDKEWEEVTTAFKEGKDLGALAKKLGAWPLIASEMDYLEGKTASIHNIARRIAMSIMSGRIVSDVLTGFRGLQVERKDKDQMSDTGGRSKRPDKEPDFKPPREDMKNRFRTRKKTPEQRDPDVDRSPDKKQDKDVKTAASHPLDTMTRKVRSAMVGVGGRKDFLGVTFTEDISLDEAHNLAQKIGARTWSRWPAGYYTEIVGGAPIDREYRSILFKGVPEAESYVKPMSFRSSDMHPLDRKEKSNFGFMIPENNYHRQVLGALTGILAETRGVSEKSFSAYESIMQEAEAEVRSSRNQEQIGKCQADGKRPNYCAELLYGGF